MIYGISGRPGAGKSYECVTKHIIPALNDKRKIITNIPLNLEWFINVYGPEVRELIVLVDGDYHNYGSRRPFSSAPDFLKYDTWRNEKNQGVYFFIDECHLAMPAGGTDKELKEYLSMHRHYGHDIMLLTQNFRKVDRDVKDMVNTCYFCTKLSMLAKDNQYVCKVADGVNQRSVVNQFVRDYEPKYFGAYQSHTKVKASVQEAATVGVVPWYRRKTTLGAVALCLFGTFIIGGQLAKEKPDLQAQAAEKIKNINASPSNQVAVVTTQQQQSPQPSSQQEKPKEPKKAEHPFTGVQLHLSGYYADNDRRGRYNKIYYFALSRNGQMLSELTHVDLQLAGYTVKIYNPCAAEISYGDYHAFVLCDTPTQSVEMPGDQLVAAQ